MESFLIAILRDILGGTLSLDDGLSAIQNLFIAKQQRSELLFEIARAIEEIILRRPKVASAKFTELSVRLTFDKERTIPELLLLLDTRYTSNYRRSECEILPDIEAIPELLDILGELAQAIDTAKKLNLRPLLPFLADDVVVTLDAICERGQKPITLLAMREVHYLANVLSEFEFFEGAELLLNRLMELTQKWKMTDFWFEVSMDEASVLTELAMYEQSRAILKKLESVAKRKKDTKELALVKLTLCINETRDDSTDYKVARALGDEAAALFERIQRQEQTTPEGLGLAHLIIGSSILANGWREAIPQAISRLEKALAIFERATDKSPHQLYLLYGCLVNLGFAHGVLGDHDNLSKGTEYFEHALTVLESLKEHNMDVRWDMAACMNALGWICLCSECDEFWPLGLRSFETALRIREELLQSNLISKLEYFGTVVGTALSKLHVVDRLDPETEEFLRDSLMNYFSIFPTDQRAYNELAIGTYDLVWLASRHNLQPSETLMALLEDIDRMLVETQNQVDSIYINGVSLVIPFFMDNWPLLYSRAMELVKSGPEELRDVARLIAAFASIKMNLEEVSLEARVRLISPVDESIEKIDPVLMQYWTGQNILAKTLKSFYDNKNYYDLANDFYRAAVVFGRLSEIEYSYNESTEFIKATGVSLAYILLRFAHALSVQFDVKIEQSEEMTLDESGFEQFEFILANNWTGLLRITENYLQMVEQLEYSRAQPYLNAVFSNITRAVRMMDSIAMVDRRILSYLGDVMGRRYYLR